MENPVMGLYIDGIPILDKNSYDFDWEGIASARMLRGPQGTLFGRNAMGGVLSLRTLSPFDGERARISLEYGSANTIRLGASATFGRNAVSATFRHGSGFFENIYKSEKCDPYDGLSVRWKREKFAGSNLYLSNVLSASISKEGGFAYGQYLDGKVQPVSYNDEGSYRRLSVVEGFRLRYSTDKLTAEGIASLQVLADDMKMDQDYTPRSVFTLRQKQNSYGGTLELTVRKNSLKDSWQPVTGVFASLKRNSMDAPVTFKRDGIEDLILSNANRNIPQDIGYLSISDQWFPVNSEFIIYSGNAAIFHESVFKLGDWAITAGIRLDYEGGQMDYDCISALHYRFVPTMQADKEFSLPYNGGLSHSRFVVLPKLSVSYKALENLSVFMGATKGYRAGGFNTQIFSDILQNLMMNGIMKDLGVYFDNSPTSKGASSTEYDPEYAWDFELGANYKKGDLKIASSLYYISVRNQQLTVFPPGKSTGRMMANAGKSRSFGAEVSIEWNPGNFHSEIIWSYCNARFENYTSGTSDYSGNRIPYVPGHTLYAGAGHRFTIGKKTLSVDLGLRGAGPIYWNEENTLKEPLRLYLSGRAALDFGKWELFLRGDNLTGTTGYSFYFKTVGNEFLARVKPRIITTGINIKL